MFGNKEDRTAFARGFFKGLGAPAMAFGKVEPSKIKSIPHINLKDIISSDGLAKDAMALSGDFIKALDKTK